MLPIRKIKPNVVALSSYYGKTFIQCSEYTRNDPVEWLFKTINRELDLLSSDRTSQVIVKIYPNNVYDSYFIAPRIYNAISNKISKIDAVKFELVFDHKWRLSNVDPTVLKAVEVNGAIVCGKTKKSNNLIIVKPDNLFYLYSNGEYKLAGNIYEILEISEASVPIDFATIRIFSKTIPVGVVLGYLLGFDTLLRMLNVEHTVEDKVRGRASSLLDSKWRFSFRDKTYTFNKKDMKATLIMGGFKAYSKFISDYDVSEFNEQNVYMNILEEQRLGSIYLKEIDNSNDLFIDPVTKSILEDMKMPVTFTGLIIKAVELLENYNTPDFQDMNSMRIRGYERFSGAVYKELAHAVRAFKSRSIRGRSQIELNPYAVWKNISQDPSVKLVEDINPIQNLKESESVTYVGEGGRDKSTLVRDSRAYHSSDIGIVSEATSDSADVGVNFYLSANPQFKNIRGLPDTTAKVPNSSRFSTSVLLAPMSDHDD